jgi:carbamoyltransferase
LLGPGFDQADIERRLSQAGARYTVLAEDAMIAETATRLAAQEVVGWFQDRMEFGPRALGARSILGDPRSPAMQKTVNLKVKFRESFRPFAPAILEERTAEWFMLDRPSPYMLFVAPVREERRKPRCALDHERFGIDLLNVVRSEIPAVTHVDYSARVQTVASGINPRFRALLERFDAITGCPILLNTSFNVRGEPIVATPEEAFDCFMGTDIDALAVGRCFLRKHDQDQRLRRNQAARFAAD